MFQKSNLKNLNFRDGKPSSFYTANALDRDKAANCREKEFGHRFSKDLQGCMESSLKAMYNDRFEKINERIDKMLTAIFTIDRKVDEMHEEMTSSKLEISNDFIKTSKFPLISLRDSATQ